MTLCLICRQPEPACGCIQLTGLQYAQSTNLAAITNEHFTPIWMLELQHRYLFADVLEPEPNESVVPPPETVMLGRAIIAGIVIGIVAIVGMCWWFGR